MGSAVLFGMTLERKVKPIASLIVTATGLLLWQPGWIWNLGFQLSFLATLGLLVTVPVLTDWLDWMPTKITPYITVPIAAFLWTLPLQLYAFGVVSPYSILVNILVSPLLAVVSMGGMLSALLALIYPPLGSGLAGLLNLPLEVFLQITRLSGQLPGSSLAVGTIAAWQVLLLYGLFVLVWWQQRWQRRWWVVGIVALSLVIVPIGYTTAHLLRITLLENSGQLVLVVQERGKVGLIYRGDENTAKSTILPFLRQQGVNRIDWAIAPHIQPAHLLSWQSLLNGIVIKRFYSQLNINRQVNRKDRQPQEITAFSRQYQNFLGSLRKKGGDSLQLSYPQTLAFGDVSVKLLGNNLPVWSLYLGNLNWLFLGSGKSIQPNQVASAQVLLWSGAELNEKILEQINPKTAIATRSAIALKTAAWLQRHQVTVYRMGIEGAIEWTPQQGIRPVIVAESES